MRRTEGKVEGRVLRKEEEGMKEGEATILRQGFHLHDFYSLCRGEVRKGGRGVYFQISQKVPFSTAPPSPLCYLSAKDDPHLLLAPLKVEEVSR